ncbi:MULTISPECIES: imidazoleglycerol-phosphate dehydratase [Acidianus]|uniref:Imidazoleglycerol-phosphate dehydratase n=1 Tax=Candidatus Acidianus copahuensis TaxID=1160895 RepID=A0A031LV66_9CREN|nr:MULTISPECIES: imidazoleglycerol-phosphate dehydratase [Acidianus]EZQ11028.1 imidazoleglycerol-phosphate dehydratase [Candidatus Acidianus copahuensis]NON62603.1 imidazoleglycerol-phosphate dehydratase [Acidianus sp. RZ1]
MSRQSTVVRETKETKIEIKLELDSPGEVTIRTPVPFFNHMLKTMGFYMGISLMIDAEDKLNYDDHHIVEDVGITLGQAIKEALGSREGIKRFANAIVPMDEALVLSAVDVSGRGIAFTSLKLKREQIGGLSMENVSHFFWSLSVNSGITLHVKKLRGLNEHHIVEAAFKAVGLSLGEAIKVSGKDIRSTKGLL